MLTQVNVNGKTQMGIVFENCICSRKDLILMRDSLLDMLTTCISTEEAKDRADSTSLYNVIAIIEEFNKDIESEQ